MKIEDYIIVQNTIPKNVCKEIIDECNTKRWVKHQWNNYTTSLYNYDFNDSENDSKQNSSVPNMDNLKTTKNKNYNEPL